MKRAPRRHAATSTRTAFSRHLTIKNRADEVDSAAAAINYKHQVKAVAASRICYFIMQRSGVRHEEMKYADPVLHYIEALVYRGDLETEHHQREGRHSTDSSWHQAITQILHSAGLADTAVLAELDELHDYYARETHVMLHRPPLDADTIRDLCYRRSSHFRMLLRAWHLAVERPYDENFFRLGRHACARFEIAQDLHTYAEDFDDDAFNLLRLEVWSHGEQAALDKLHEIHRGIVADMHLELNRMPRHTLLSVLPAFLTSDSTRFLPCLPAPVLRRLARRRLAKLARLTESQSPSIRPEISHSNFSEVSHTAPGN